MFGLIGSVVLTFIGDRQTKNTQRSQIYKYRYIEFNAFSRTFLQSKIWSHDVPFHIIKFNNKYIFFKYSKSFHFPHTTADTPFRDLPPPTPRKVFNSVNFFIASEARNVRITFVEKPVATNESINKFSKHGYLFHSSSYKGF